MPASAVLARPRHPAAPQTGSFPPRDQRRYLQGPIRRARGLHHGVLGAWDGVRPTRVPWGSLGCARALSAWAGGGAWGCSFPQDSPTQLWGAVESARVSAGLSWTEGPWHPLHHQGKLGPWSQRKWTAALAMHGADADMGEKQRGTRVAGPRPRRLRRKGRAPRLPPRPGADPPGLGVRLAGVPTPALPVHTKPSALGVRSALPAPFWAGGGRLGFSSGKPGQPPL